MDEISKISFNSVGHKRAANDKIKKEVPEKQSEQQPERKEVTPDAIFSALKMSAEQNKAQLGIGAVDPKKYLSEERIKDIEASMQVFDSGVQDNLTMLEKEFGFLPEFSSLSDADKLEMAAKSFATI